MARKTNSAKREAILDAMLDVVVEHGFHEAPMSLVAKRSGASPGVIYHYFSSKDEIIQAVYERLSELKGASLLKGYSPQMEAKEAAIHVWINAYRFFHTHARELRFLDMYESAGFVCPPDKHARLSAQAAEFEQRFLSKSKGGPLTNLPNEVLLEMTFGLAARLAKQQRKLSAKLVRSIAEQVWLSIRAKE
jgi:AcrR family transcriptional regulator